MSSFWQMIIMLLVKAFLKEAAEKPKEEVEKIAKNIKAGIKAYNT